MSYELVSPQQQYIGSEDAQECKGTACERLTYSSKEIPFNGDIEDETDKKHRLLHV